MCFFLLPICDHVHSSKILNEFVWSRLVKSDDILTEEQNEMVESAAEMLYGLIHVRYILTSKGMNAMVCLLLRPESFLLSHFLLPNLYNFLSDADLEPILNDLALNAA